MKRTITLRGPTFDAAVYYATNVLVARELENLMAMNTDKPAANNPLLSCTRMEMICLTDLSSHRFQLFHPGRTIYSSIHGGNQRRCVSFDPVLLNGQQ